MTAKSELLFDVPANFQIRLEAIARMACLLMLPPGIASERGGIRLQRGQVIARITVGAGAAMDARGRRLIGMALANSMPIAIIFFGGLADAVRFQQSSLAPVAAILEDRTPSPAAVR